MLSVPLSNAPTLCYVLWSNEGVPRQKSGGGGSAPEGDDEEEGSILEFLYVLAGIFWNGMFYADPTWVDRKKMPEKEDIPWPEIRDMWGYEALSTLDLPEEVTFLRKTWLESSDPFHYVELETEMEEEPFDNLVLSEE